MMFLLTLFPSLSSSQNSCLTVQYNCRSPQRWTLWDIMSLSCSDINDSDTQYWPKYQWAACWVLCCWSQPFEAGSPDFHPLCIPLIHVIAHQDGYKETIGDNVKALRSPRYAISSSLITVIGNQILMKRGFVFGVILIQPHSLQFVTDLAGISGWHMLFCIITHAGLFLIQTSHP